MNDKQILKRERLSKFVRRYKPQQFCSGEWRQSPTLSYVLITEIAIAYLIR